MSVASFPKVSLLVLAYRQRQLLDQAVAAAFAQDCEPIEIVLSDDGSDDGSFERLQALAAGYRGPHRVQVRPRTANLGIAGHYNALVEFASGELLVTAAGDDVSVPDRVRRLVQAWDAGGRRADLIASHLIDMDAEGGLHCMIRVDDLGRWRGVNDWMQHRPHVVGAAHAFTRRAMQHFGPMRSGIAYEDQITVFRALALGGGLTVDAALVHYRRGGTSGRPNFENVEQLAHWTLRRLDRQRAECEQLLADAQVAGSAQRMREVLDLPMRREQLLRVLLGRPPWKQRWRALREAAPVALSWRLRKLLDTAVPNTTFRVKSLLQRLRRQTGHERLAVRSVPEAQTRDAHAPPER